MFDARPGGSSGPPGISGDQDPIGVGLGHSSRNGADPDLRDELDADLGGGVGILQIIDELRKIFDRVDVMMWGVD